MRLSDLIPRLQVQVNGPGGSFFDVADEDGWLDSLTNAFWTGRLRGFFPDYRIGADGDSVVNVNDVDLELDETLGQVIILYAAYGVLKAKLTELNTKTFAKAGPVESERQKSAQLLTELLKQTWQELEDIREEAESAGYSGVARFADLVLMRSNQYWVN